MTLRGTQNETVVGVTATIVETFIVVMRERPILAGSLWFSVFAILLSFSWALGIVPTIEADETDNDDKAQIVVVEDAPKAFAAQADPVRIIIDAIGIDTTIVNPESRSIDVLDQALLQGVVRYPGSAQLGELGNVLLFGHSTGFRVVNNPAFKVFNDLKQLAENDLIRVQSSSREYVYRVRTVSLVNADEALVDLSTSGRRLTLSTCNSFGAKQERYVVDAELVGEYAI